MIAKVIPAKGGGRTFGALVDYVSAENRLDRPVGREFEELVRYVGREDTVEPLTGEVTPKAIAIETQASRRCVPRPPKWRPSLRSAGSCVRRRIITSSSPGTRTSTRRRAGICSRASRARGAGHGITSVRDGRPRRHGQRAFARRDQRRLSVAYSFAIACASRPRIALRTEPMPI